MGRNECRSTAFTITELIIVVAILSVLVTMSVPTLYQSLKEWRVNQFSRSVLTAHQAARFRAITERRHLQVRYDMPENEITFYQCSDINDKGGCDSWRRYWPMGVVKPSNETVDLWSVGHDKTVAEACMYFKPSGQVFDPVDRSGAPGEDCQGPALGTGVHVTWRPNPKPATDVSNHCKWNTIYVLGSSGSPAMLDYGAYPSDKGPFQNTLGSKPPCAK